MGFTSLSEIKEAYEKFQNDTTWLETKRRLQDDFQLWRLAPYNPGSKYVSFTSNIPKITANKNVSLLIKANLIIRIPLDYLREADREEASNVERLLYGCFVLNDRRLRLLGKPPLKAQKAWYLTLRGGYFERPYIYKDAKTKLTTVDISAWDRYNVAFARGAKGLAWAVHARRASREAIKEEYGIDILGHNDSVVFDYWDTEKNGVIIDAVNEWGKPLTKHGLDYCPVYEILAGAMPDIWQNDDSTINQYRGESIYDALRGLSPIKNKTLSDLLTIVRRGVKSPVATYTKDGEGIGEEDIWSVEEGHLIDMEVGEKMEQVFQPELPRDAMTLLGEIAVEEQLAGFPRTSYGQLGFRLSGLAVNQLNEAVEGVNAPFLEAMQYGYSVACDSLLDQYAGSKFKPLKIRGRTSRGEAFGYPAGEEIKPSDIKREWYPEVKLEPVLPKDDPQNVYMARLIKEAGLMSDETIMDTFLGIEDTDLERNKLEAQWASNIPVVKLQRLLNALLERGEIKLAALVYIEIQKLQRNEQGMAQGGGQQARSPTRQETASLEQPGMGMPLRGAGGEVGLPSSVLPSEALGGLPSGAMGAE